MPAPNTLGLDDDLDSIDLLIAVERAFDIKISDQEAAAIATMGNLHDVVASKLDGAGGVKCQTSMAFYRVRRALQAVVGPIELRPETLLSAVWRGSPKALWSRAQRHCDLRLPPLSQTAIGLSGALLIVAVIFGAPIAPIALVAKVDGITILALIGGLIAASFALLRIDPLSFKPMTTIGDLAKRTATQNYGALARLGGRSNDFEIWSALVEIVSTHSEHLPAENIQRSTLFFESQLKKARADA